VDGHAGSIKWVGGEKKKRRKRKCSSEKDPSGHVLHVITRQRKNVAPPPMIESSLTNQ
jgi:hypothetical protein